MAIRMKSLSTRANAGIAPILLMLLCEIYSGYATDSGGGNARKTKDDLIVHTEHRVILRPGTWKIRPNGHRPTYLSYAFFLGINWTASDDVNYPNCSRVACGGLLNSQGGCDRICDGGSWRAAVISVTTAAGDYSRAAMELDASFNDLVAIAHTHLEQVQGSKTESNRKLFDPNLRGVDVMRSHRESIEKTWAAVKSTSETFALRETEDGVERRNSTSEFLRRMTSWMNGALVLSVQLNSMTFALIGARERLLACTQGVLRSDMTGCIPGFTSEFYTDVPTASGAKSSSSSPGFALEVRRERWNPVSLSRWYMAFVDSSRENRTCWLDRSMLNDSSSVYREPRCDARGLCDPLEPDDETIPACEVRPDGEVSAECPVVCGSPCFGPICYKSRSGSYALRSAVDPDPESRFSSEILAAQEPRTLSKAYSLSEEEVRSSLLQMRHRAERALEQLDRGVSVARVLRAVDSKLQSYVDKIDSGKDGCLRERDACMRSIARGGIAATASLVFSALSSPLLIFLILKLRC